MQYVIGKKLAMLAAAQWEKLVSEHSGIWVDVGTGDGLFIYETARNNPGVLCIGFDPVWENMSEVSWRASRKVQKGGVSNALFLLGALETYSDQLKGLASRIWVNYPWAGVLKGVVSAEQLTLKRLRDLGKMQCGVEMNINYHVLTSLSDSVSLQLPRIDKAYIEAELLPKYRSFGFVSEGYEILSGAPVRTTWGKQLALGSDRETLHLRFKLA